MRLTSAETDIIRDEVHRLDPDARIHLFGSRADDSARGGDIDLLVISDCLSFRDMLRLRAAILDRIGWQQMDLLIRKRNQLNEPFVAMAMQNGVSL